MPILFTMQTYTEEYIKVKLERSKIWVTRAFLAINEAQRVKEVDKDLFSSMSDYYSRFNTISDKHVSFLRKKLMQRYAQDLVEIANSNMEAV